MTNYASVFLQDEDGFRDEYYDDADGDWGGPKELIKPEVIFAGGAVCTM